MGILQKWNVNLPTWWPCRWVWNPADPAQCHWINERAQDSTQQFCQGIAAVPGCVDANDGIWLTRTKIAPLRLTQPMPRSSASASTSASTSASSAAHQPASYEAALTELDGLVQQMEGGQMPLDRLLDGYRRGAELLAFCKSRLQAVENQVKVLEDGQLKDWAPQ